MAKRTIFAVFVVLFIPGFKTFSQHPADSVQHDRRSLNSRYFMQYFKNAELSYISPCGELGAPDKYVLTSHFRSIFLLFAHRDIPVSFAASPEVLVRVRQEQSAGVRTPSFKISGNLMVRISNEEERYRYFELGFVHHSNGQDGEALNSDGSINTRTGNFTTNFVTAAYRFGGARFRMDRSGQMIDVNHKLAGEFHRLFRFERALGGDYGFTRLHYQLSLRASNTKGRALKGLTGKETWRLNAEASYATNIIRNVPFLRPARRLNAELSYHYSLPFMGNTYLMGAIGYYGEDPYNIYYRNHYGFIRLGFSASLPTFRAAGN